MAKKFTAKEARTIGTSIGIDWRKIRLNEFRMGLSEELEHKDVTGGDLSITGKIALAHLHEMPDYYTKLSLMQNGAMCPCSPLHGKLTSIDKVARSIPKKSRRRQPK